MQGLTNQQSAVLKVLYSQQPQFVGERFLEIRRWETPNGYNTDLIVECGRLDAQGDLETESQVFPFYMSVSDVLQVMQ